MTKDFVAGVRELIFQDIPNDIREVFRFLWKTTAPLRTFAVERALFLTAAAWLLLISIILLCLPFGEDRNPLNPSDWLGRNDATGLRDYLWAMSFPLGALLVSLTLTNALRRTRIMDIQTKNSERELESNISSKRDELNASTFSKATELLMIDDRIAAISGICTIEELMISAFEDTSNPRRLSFGKMMGSFLSIYIRQRAHLLQEKTDGADDHIDRDLVSFDAMSALIRNWPTEYRQPSSTGRGIDLRGIQLKFWTPPPGSDFCLIDFSGSHFFNCFFENINFGKANLSSSTIGHSTFKNCTFNDIDLTHTQFTESDFYGSSIDHSIFGKTLFLDCNFHSTQAPTENTSGVDFKGCKFNAD